MDADEIRTLLGENIFERAKKYRKRIQQSTCTVNEDGVRHLSAVVQGKGGSYYYRHGCGRTAALSVRPATALTMKTARAPTASTSVRCCWKMPNKTPRLRLLCKTSRTPSRALPAARRA